MKPGIYHDISNADYHATTAINASFLKSWVMKSPMLQDPMMTLRNVSLVTSDVLR